MSTIWIPIAGRALKVSGAQHSAKGPDRYCPHLSPVRNDEVLADGQVADKERFQLTTERSSRIDARRDQDYAC